MKIQKFEPPKCQGCGKPLEVVYENEYWTYIFDETAGNYNKRDLSDIEIRCPECHMNLNRQLPEGACNYQAEIPKKT